MSKPTLDMNLFEQLTDDTLLDRMIDDIFGISYCEHEDHDNWLIHNDGGVTCLKCGEAVMIVEPEELEWEEINYDGGQTE